MTDQPIRVLVVEDNPSDALLLQENLAQVAPTQFRPINVERLAKALEYLRREFFDVILLDLGLPDNQGLEALLKLNKHAPGIPILVLTGLADERLGLQALQQGAQDYLVKGQVEGKGLARAIRYAIQRKQGDEAMAEQRAFLRQVIDINPHLIFAKDREGRFTLANQAVAIAYGTSVETIIGKTDADLNPHIAEVEHFRRDDLEVINSQQERVIHEEILTDAQGRIRWLQTVKRPLIGRDGLAHQVLGVATDITTRKQAEAELAQRATQLVLINNIGSQIAAMFELNAVLDRVADLVEKGFGYHHVALFLIEGEMAWLKAIAGSYRTYFPPNHSQSLGQGIIGWVGRHGQKVIANNVEADPRYISLMTGQSLTQAELCLPIRVADQVVGILDIQSPYLNTFSQNDVMAMETLTDQIAVAIQNGRLYQAAQQELAERRETEEILATERYRLRALIDNLPDLIFLKDRHSRYMVANEAVAQFMGAATPEALLGKSDFDFYPPERAAQYFSLEQQIMRSGESVVGWEHPHLDLQGNYYWFSTIKMALHDQQGNIVGLVGIERDITKRKKAEEEVQRRNRELALLNRIINAGTAGLETEVLLDIACRELALAFNLPLVTAVLHNEQKTIVRVVAEYRESKATALDNIFIESDDAALHHLLNYEGPFVVEEAHSDPRLALIQDWLGRRGITSLLFLPLRIDGEVMGALSLEALKPHTFSAEEVSLAWNVAEQVAGALSRARLSQVQQRLSTAIEQAAETIIITDTQGTIVYVNPAFERSSGYSRAEVMDQTPRILKSDRHEDAVYRKMWATISAGEVWRGRFINRRKDETLYTAEATITPVRNESGAIVSYVAVQHDVTRELQLEEQYRQAQKMEAVGRLTAGVAHDFNNLLTTINGFASLIQAELQPDDSIQEMLETILRSGQRASDLVRQLLVFSRKQVLQPEVLNLNDLTTNIEKMLQRLIREDIDLLVVAGSNLGQVKADPGQIEQVILNLVVNACDAMPVGGKLTIETANVEFDKKYARDHVSADPGPYVMLAVSDTGIGMAAEIQSHIFEPFFTTKEQGQGTGLGLATVYGIVKQSGGDIQVYSEVGQGTSFKIYLPRIDEVLPPPEAQASHLKPPPGLETVLLVEDEAGVRSLARRALELSGYTVLEADHGLEALRLCKEQLTRPIHLLLTDVVMPGGVNGPELAERVRLLHPGLKVLLMSGYTDEAIIHQQGRMAPGFFFLQKPFTPNLLVQKVREVLDATASESRRSI